MDEPVLYDKDSAMESAISSFHKITLQFVLIVKKIYFQVLIYRTIA